MSMLSRRTFLLCAVTLVVPFASSAQTQSFSDVPPTDPFFPAVEHLKARGVISGYDDGTFRVKQAVTRSEVAKMIASASIAAAEIDALAGQSAYADTAKDSWFAKYVMALLSKGIIDGPPQKTDFRPADTIVLAEFLKIYLLAQKVDVQGAYSDISIAVSSDVLPDAWHYVFVRYALASSMITVSTDGLINPGKGLTRGDIAMLMYRKDMYSEGRRNQANLATAENEILNMLKMLEEKRIEEAEFASARALLAARGALASKPDEGIIKGAVKTAEAFRSLVLAYRAGMEARLDDVIKLSSDAWHLAEKAREFSPGLDSVATQIQTIASNMATEARKLKGQG